MFRLVIRWFVGGKKHHTSAPRSQDSPRVHAAEDSTTGLSPRDAVKDFTQLRKTASQQAFADPTQATIVPEVAPTFGRKVSEKNRSRGVAPAHWKRPAHIPDRLRGICEVQDGDTIKIGEYWIRLAGIDAPELDHLFGYNAKCAMRDLCNGHVVTAYLTDEMSYNRVVGTCYLPDGRDLAAEIVKQGLAIDWPKYSGGKYRRYETADVRTKLDRAVQRQQGRRHRKVN